jgi:hypothetical protein
VQYRERLDKTLSSFDLTNDQKLKSLVESQFCRSSQSEMELEGNEIITFFNFLRACFERNICYY